MDTATDSRKVALERVPDETDEELLRCNRCGYCLAVCPTYQCRLDERRSARGRNELVRLTREGAADLSAEIIAPVSECLLCGACTTACFGKVKTAEVMERARADWVAAHGDPLVLRLIFDQILPRPDRLTRLMRLLSLGKRSGLADVAQRLGVLRWINAALDGAAGLVGTMPSAFLRDRLPAMGFERVDVEGSRYWRLRPADGAAGPRVLYFIGCGTNYQVPRQGEAAIRLLHHAGCEVIVTDNVCCGLPPHSYGHRPAATHLIRRNVEMLGAIPFDMLVTECGSCSAFIHRWPELLADDAAARSAADIAARCADVSAALCDLNLAAAPGEAGLTVTYHDPCHLARGLGVRDEPRRLLTDVAGLQLSELVEADWCCGGAGSYNIAHPELSLSILDRKQRRIQESGAQVVATSCPACVIQLSYGMRRAGLNTPVRHVTELAAERLGLLKSP